MASPNPSSNYQTKINHHLDEGELGIDIEPIDNTIDPTSLTFPSDNIEVVAAADDAADIETMEIEGEQEQEDAAARTNVYNGFGGFNFLSKKAIFLFAFISAVGLGVVIGFGLSGIIEHKRQQQQRYQENALAAVAGQKKKKGGKPGKVCLNDHDPIDDEEEFCAEEQVIQCGATFTNEKVEISHDLLCTDYILDATPDQKRAHNAAITLTGPNASIDCKGHTIRQIIRHEFTIQSCPIGQVWPPLEPSDDRKHIKERCWFFYQAGILLVDGATAVNCNVENFYDGYHIVNGGEVKKSEALGNQNGVTIQDLTGTTESKVTDVYTYENVYGVLMANAANSNNVATIQDVTSKLNHIAGFALSGPDITVKDSTASYNGEGFRVSEAYGLDLDPTQPFVNKLQFEGTFSSHNNFWTGMRFHNNRRTTSDDVDLDFEVIVKGEVKNYLNGGDGLVVQIWDYWSTTLPNYYLSFIVEDGGSWESCQNGEIDVLHTGDQNFGTSGGTISFVDEGGTGGFACDTSAVEHGAQGLPICVPCPACN